MIRVRSSAGKPLIVPLFKTYLFCDLDESPFWTIIRRQPGVINFIMAGDVPSKCPDIEIAKLMASEIDGVVQLVAPPPADTRPAVGSKIKIAFGSLAGHEGTYVAHKGLMKARVTVFLLGREVTVEIAAGALAPIAA